MDAKSMKKVMAAGFSIVRKLDTPTPRITVRTAHAGWKVLTLCDTKAERDRKFDELMENEKIITD